MRTMPRIVISILFILISAVQALAQDPVLSVVEGFTDSGGATDQWLAMLRKRLPDARFDSVSRIRKALSPDEAQWAALIRSRVSSWERELPGLAEPFQPIAPPTRVSIVMGNRGGNDGFTHDPTTIGFDLAALRAEYGEATTVGKPDLIDRLFRHEYTHLIQKAWWPSHPYDMSTPLRYALAEIWAEGIGNYYSMSDKWRVANGKQSDATAEALQVLEPRFVARLAALSCTTPERAKALTADLSWGRFDRKWGAITPALWLEAEASASDQAMRRFIAAGPDGVWELAARHLPEPLRATLAEARAAGERCAVDRG